MKKKMKITIIRLDTDNHDDPIRKMGKIIEYKNTMKDNKIVLYKHYSNINKIYISTLKVADFISSQLGVEI